MPSFLRPKVRAGGLLALALFACHPKQPDSPARAPEETGGSYFADLVEQNGGEIPFPFEKLLNDFYPKVRKFEDEALPFVLIPKGRSLQRRSADFRNPRIVAGLGWRFPILLGYAPTAGEIEVISFNPREARFDFHTVKDYREGGHPKLVAANRASCVACHQNGGPIFSRAPWREAREPPLLFRKKGKNLVAEAIIRARKEAGDDSKRYHGLDLASYADENGTFKGNDSRGPSGVFNFYYRTADELLQRKHAMKTVCGDDLDCRMLLLKTALVSIPLRYRTEVTSGKKGVKELQSYIDTLQSALKKHWPSDGFAYASPVLPDRKILGVDPPVGFVLRPLLNGRDATYHEIISDFMPEDFEYYLAHDHVIDFGQVQPGKFREERSNDKTIVDPMVTRPMVAAIPWEKSGAWIFYQAFLGLNFNSPERALLMPQDPERLSKVLDGDPRFKELCRTWPVDTDEVMATVLADLKLDEAAKPYLMSLKNRGGPVRALPALAKASSAGGSLFVKYCYSCHASNDEAGFLPLEDTRALAAIPEVCDQLSRKKMPPASGNGDGKAKTAPSDEERQAMLKLANCKL
jgi:mono/diheme cytochrome c family protein